MIRYRYLGGGFLIGVPARDLTADDLAHLPIPERGLLQSGLYAAVDVGPPEVTGDIVGDVSREEDNDDADA